MTHRTATRYTKSDPHPMGKFPASTAPTDRDVLFVTDAGYNMRGRLSENGWVYSVNRAVRMPVRGGPYDDGQLTTATHWAEPIT